MKTNCSSGALLCAFFFAQSIHLLAQGSLTPPAGTPAPTMKSLDQLEPRTDLFKAPASAVTTTDVNYHYIITQPGSYYLSGNLVATRSFGIKIDAEGVTLDLHGFQISRNSGGNTAIEITATSHRATVRDGVIRGFSNGLQDFGATGGHYTNLVVSNSANSSIFSIGSAVIIDSCRVVNSTGTNGIHAGEGSTIVGCVVFNGTHTTAISADEGSSILRCVASNNTAVVGISVLSGGLITDCVARNNTSSSANSSGISGGINSVVTNCTSSDNKTTATATNLTGMGFSLGSGSTIEHCNAAGNQGNGIRLVGRSVARHNQCSNNGNAGDGAGIHAINTVNCIDSNTVSNNDRGIDVDGTASVVIRNLAGSNVVAYQIAADNRFGPIINISGAGVAAQSVNNASPSVSSVMGSTDPWANFLY